MTIGTSAALGTVLSAVEAGIAPGIAGEDIGIGPMPGPGRIRGGARRRRLDLDRGGQG
jgi:hypothetical protein